MGGGYLRVLRMRETQRWVKRWMYLCYLVAVEAKKTEKREAGDK